MKLKKVDTASAKPTKKSRRLHQIKSVKSRITTPNKLGLKKIKKKRMDRRRTWTNFQMKQAIDMVKSNTLNLSQAANRFNVPLSTLSKYLKDDIQIEDQDSNEDLESVEELSEIVSENGIESSSVSSFSSRVSKDSEPVKAVYMARKSTSPLKVLLKQPGVKHTIDEQPTDDILKKFEEQKQMNRVKKDDFQKDQAIDTNSFIDSILSNTDKQKYTFLKEFEKPIKLYSYIGLRQKYHPVFLNRNLSYLNDTKSNHKPNLNFKVDDLLEIKKMKYKKPVENEMQLKLDSIQIINKDDRNYINENVAKKNENIKIEICLLRTESEPSQVLSLIPNKNIQLVNQSSMLVITLIQSQFIPIKIDPTFKYFAINVKICDKIFNFKYKLCDLANFFVNCPRSTPSKSNLFDFTFKLDSQNGPKSPRSVQSLIDSFNSSNLIKFKVKITRSTPSQIELKTQQATKKRAAHVFYQFSDQNEKKLITKTSSLKCPFCPLNSQIQDHTALFKHLLNCHFRLQIKQSITQNGVNSVKIDLSIEDTFDGSYCGYLHDLIKNCHLGFTKSRLCPTKQISMDTTEILCNKRSFNLNLKDLIKNENLSREEIDTLAKIQQQLVKISSSIDQAAQQKNNFMQRVYYHTVTSQPVHINEINYDSDSEMDPEWLKELTTLLINDFADVNEGEKELMKLWNLHCLHYNFVADSQIYSACAMFIDEKAHTLVKSKLVNNFILHLVNLNDYNLLNLNSFVKLIDYLSQKLAQIQPFVYKMETN